MDTLPIVDGLLIAGFAAGATVLTLTRWPRLLGRASLQPPAPAPGLHQQQLDALGLLARGLAHDFNNLLGAMAGNVELAALDSREGAPIQPYLATLEALVSRSGQLVKQILALSGSVRPEPVPLDLNEQIAEISRLLRVSLARPTRLRLELAPELPAIVGDQTQIRQLVMNLVLLCRPVGAAEPELTTANGTPEASASEAEPGVLVLRTGTERPAPDGLQAGEPGQVPATGPQVFLEVEDPTPPSPAALGPGLEAIKAIARAHHGVAHVRQEPGRTAIRLVFPALTAEPAASAPPALTAEGSEGLASIQGFGTILVVDDEAPLRATAVQALRRSGFQTLEAEDGLAALHIFESHRSRIRLIIMDLNMPRMDGEEAFRVLRRSGVRVPVLVSSGYNQVDVLGHFHGKGIAGFLQKPYRLRDLLEGVQQALIDAEQDAAGMLRRPVPWSRQLETSNPTLDHQHQLLIAAFNQLVLLVQAKAPGSDQQQAFQALMDMTLAHFCREEGLMERFGYPRRRQHQSEHANLTAQVQDLARHLGSGRLRLTPAVLDFLEGWLVHHMQEEDALLARFLEDRGH